MTHVDICGPDYKGSLRGGAKTLFQLASTNARHVRLVVTEAPISALGVTAIEGLRADTRYAATGGGMGSGTIAAIDRLLAAIAPVPGATLYGGTDAAQVITMRSTTPRSRPAPGSLRTHAAETAMVDLYASFFHHLLKLVVTDRIMPHVNPLLTGRSPVQID